MLPWLDQNFGAAWQVSPRAFQRECFERLIQNVIINAVVNITPAAGKTRLGVMVAKWRLSIGQIRNIVVVAPTTEVCDSWKREFAAAGIQMATDFRKDAPLDTAYVGVCVTYASVFTTPDWYRYKFGGSTLVIFDEIHHLEDQSGWGEKARKAFDVRGNFTLGTTGTLWRPNKKESMAFVQYDANGYIVADFEYGYARALADGIVRAASFPTWDATDVRYVRAGEEKQGHFRPADGPSTAAVEREWTDTLRCAIDPSFSFLRSMIEAAHAQLMSPLLRGGNDPTAGGIFFGENIFSLEEVHRLIFKPMGIRAKVVHSDLDNADPKGEIHQYRNDPSWEWILCVKLITEGVSINRLRVGVHGCATLSELWFRQALGRLLRRLGEADAEAFYFMPRHPQLVEYAEKIEEEKRQAREMIISTGGNGGGGGGGKPLGMVPTEAQGESSIHIVGTESLDSAYVSFASQFITQAKMQAVISPAQGAKLLSAAGVAMPATMNQASALISEGILDEEKAKLSLKIEKLVRQAASINLGPSEHSQESKREEILRIRWTVLSPLDGIYKDQRYACTLPQLEARRRRMVEYLKEITR